MSFGIWSPSVSSYSPNPHQPQSVFYGETSVEGLSQHPSAEEDARYAANLSATGRRFWKRKGYKGSIWTPDLEVALIDGLKMYQQFIWKPIRDGRYTMRNRFIANYIAEKTGACRTPRQISSRIQHLKDTCQASSILDLITPDPDAFQRPPNPRPSAPSNRYSNPYPRPPHFRETSPHAPTRHGGMASDNQLELHKPSKVCRTLPLSLQLQVVIQLDKTPPSIYPPIISIISNHVSEAVEIHLARHDDMSSRGLHPQNANAHSCNRLADLNNIVFLKSPYPLFPSSLLSVFVEGCYTPVYTETTTLLCNSSPVSSGDGWIYTTSLIPSYWSTLNSSLDPTRCSIEQQIVLLCPLPSAGGSASPKADMAPTINIHYRFRLEQTYELAVHRSLDNRHMAQLASTEPSAYDGYENTTSSNLCWPNNNCGETPYQSYTNGNITPFDFPDTGAPNDWPVQAYRIESTPASFMH